MHNPFDNINDKLDKVLESNNEVKRLLLTSKETPSTNEPLKPLTFKEACIYVSLSESYMRILCHKKQIPFHKPEGRRQLQFIREELNEWMLEGDGVHSKALNKAYL